MCPRVPQTNLLRGHAGAVLALDFAPELGRSGLLFSGSVDRTIKTWDPWSGADSRLHGSRSAKEGESERACVQTLIGHNASVTSVKVLTHQRNGLVSCSLDRSVRTWFQADGRALLLYPLYVPGQVITLSGESWPTALCVRTGASCSLFVADSTGCISLYVSDSHSKAAGSVGGSDQEDDTESWHADSSFVVPRGVSGRESEGTGAAAASEASHFKLKRRFTHFHSLGISDLQLVADNCFVVSLGFDEKAQVIDAISGALSSTIANPSGARFTGCCWDSHGHMLLLGDTSGTVYMWSMFDDKIMAKKQVALLALNTPGDTAAVGITALVAIKIMSMASGGSFVFTGFAAGMKQWLINRDVGYADYLGHTQGIVSIVVKDQDEYDFLTVSTDEDTECFEDVSDGSTSRPSAMFFSASLDNTIRCWDSYERKASFGFEEQTSEITCMASSKKFRKLFTGHDNGVIKAWGAHTGEFVLAALPSKSSVTCLDCKLCSDHPYRCFFLSFRNKALTTRLSDLCLLSVLLAGMVRDQEFLVVGDLSGIIWLWEVNYDSLQRVGLLRASVDSKRVDEVAAILFSEAMYLSRAGEEFVVAGYASGVIRVRVGMHVGQNDSLTNGGACCRSGALRRRSS
jgi:WD40 repeat protein